MQTFTLKQERWKGRPLASTSKGVFIQTKTQLSIINSGASAWQAGKIFFGNSKFDFLNTRFSPVVQKYLKNIVNDTSTINDLKKRFFILCFPQHFIHTDKIDTQR